MFAQSVPVFVCVGEACRAKYRVSYVLRQRVVESLPEPELIFDPERDPFPAVALERVHWQDDNRAAQL